MLLCQQCMVWRELVTKFELERRWSNKFRTTLKGQAKKIRRPEEENKSHPLHRTIYERSLNYIQITVDMWVVICN